MQPRPKPCMLYQLNGHSIVDVVVASVVLVLPAAVVASAVVVLPAAVVASVVIVLPAAVVASLVIVLPAVVVASVVGLVVLSGVVEASVAVVCEII